MSILHGLRKVARLFGPAAGPRSRRARPSLASGEEDRATRSYLDTVVYTPLLEAIEEHDRRREDEGLKGYVNSLMANGIPRALDGQRNVVLVRHLATPNFEARHFMSLVDSLGPSFRPYILEFSQDYFNNQNDLKLGLGRLRLYEGVNRKGQHLYEHVTIIDVNASNGKPISGLVTRWEEPLVDFHHRLLSSYAPRWDDRIVDISPWFQENGPRAKDYYKALLALFLRDAILFENFLPDGKEGAFTRDIVIPAFTSLYEETGHKPLIVALEPAYNEDDAYWYSYPEELKALLRDMGMRLQVR